MKPTEGKGLVAGNALGIVNRGWGSWDCVLLLSMRQDTVKKPTEGKGLVAGNALGIVNQGCGDETVCLLLCMRQDTVRVL